MSERLPDVYKFMPSLPLDEPVATEAVLMTLAVLGESDKRGLERVLQCELADEVITAVSAHPHTQTTNSLLSIIDTEKKQYLQTLDADKQQFQRLHESALKYLAEELLAGHPEKHNQFAAVFENLANHLLADQHTQLKQLIDFVRLLPVESETLRWADYFEGVYYSQTQAYQQALTCFDQLLTYPHLPVRLQGRALNSRAATAYYNGQLQEALSGYQAGLAALNQTDDHRSRGAALLNLGFLNYELHRYDLAEHYLHQATEAFTLIGSQQWLAGVQNELGLVYRDKGMWEEALACFDKFIAQSKVDGTEDYVGFGLNNVGEVKLFQNKLDEAIAAFTDALSHMKTQTYRVDSLLNLGLAYQIQGQFDLAVRRYEEAMETAVSIDRRDIQPGIHYRMSNLQTLLGQNDEAISQLNEGIALIEATREPIEDEGLKISLLGRWQQLYEALVLHHIGRGEVVQAFTATEKARARAFADTTTNEESSNMHTIDQMQQRLAPGEIILSFFTTGVLDQDVPFLQTLPANTPLRPHLFIDPKTIIFVITSEQIRLLDCEIDPNFFVPGAPRRHDPTRWLDAQMMQQVYQILFAQVAELADARQITLIPHGPLHYVPFTAVLTTQLPRQPTLSYSPSASMWMKRPLPSPRTKPQTAPPHYIGIGYPGNDPMQQLKYVYQEVNDVAGLTDGVSLNGRFPQKDDFAAQLEQADWVHFACHSWFNYDKPLDSYLEIGPRNRLPATDVLDWSLKAQLVVLSACKSGMSRVLRGDEPMGLVRAFLSAGAKNVVVTQWSVADLPTYLLITRFFSEMTNKEKSLTVRQALQNAQEWLKTLRQSALKELIETRNLQEKVALVDIPPHDPPFAHPQYWGAFMSIS